MLKRRKPGKLTDRESPQIRSAGHLKHIRGFCCLIEGKNGHECSGKIEAMHVRSSTDGGMGLKPSDSFTVPGCSGAHHEQHQIGEGAFEHKYGISMLQIASELWAHSPHGIRWRADHQ